MVLDRTGKQVHQHPYQDSLRQHSDGIRNVETTSHNVTADRPIRIQREIMKNILSSDILCKHHFRKVKHYVIIITLCVKQHRADHTEQVVRHRK